MSNSRLVFSTDKGKHCGTCSLPIEKCQCKKNTTIYQNDGFVRISRETKGRKGKGVTLISGIPGTEIEIKELAKTLKQKCSCGGAVKDGVIEIQGDQRALIKKELEVLGYKIKLIGG
jgi:translation initiation factor 1